MKLPTLPLLLTRRMMLLLGTGAVASAALGMDRVGLPGVLAEEAGSRPHAKSKTDSDALSVKGKGAFTRLPVGEIKPAGWLQRQLRTQADGLSGHLDEFWPDVGPNSGWVGGTGESWERGPYYMDGLLPLAWQLDDPALKAKVTRVVNWTLDHQAPSGMIGPSKNDDWWPRMVMVKVLAQFYEATGDPRVLPVLTRYFHYQLGALPGRPLRDWGKYRWQDQALIVEWLYSHTNDPKLPELASLLQQQGYDWVAGFKDFKYTGVTTRAYLDSADTGGNKPEGMQTHGVNNGQALKTAAVRYLRNGNPAEMENYNRQVAALDKYHGLPNGMFSCDEHLAGLNPSQGTELCTVVETLFSMQVALAVFGDPAIGDRIEKIAYNALPGTFTDDMWAHQYNQQPNQVQVGLNSKPWTTDGPESNLYGLEPNFGCCTANYHQGWPKLTGSLWMRSAGASGDGLAATLYAPCTVDTHVGGQRVQLHEETEYPFRETVRITVTPESPARFPLQLRIPVWAAGASVRVNGIEAGESVRPGSFARLDRTWKPGDVVELHLPMAPAATRWYNRSLALSRGPLVFSLDPGENWVKLRDRGLTADWQVFPQAPWNYGLRTDEGSAPKIEVMEAAVGARPFSAAGAAVRLRVPGRRLDRWRSEDGVAQAVPTGLQTSSAPEQMLELIPYGAAKLRITAFPQLQG